MKQNFKQEVTDLKSGLTQIENILKNPKTSREKYEKAKLNREIQIARIDFFMKGYNSCKREIKEQKKLNV